MAKSTRSKVKRSYRAKKREEGVYAAVEAARLHRLSSKLKAVRDTDKDGDVLLADGEVADAESAAVPASWKITFIDHLLNNLEEASNAALSNPDPMVLDGAQSTTPNKISTHGPRGSRNEEWRSSKGLSARPKSRGMNRQGGIAGKRKAGRALRRR